MKELNPYSKSLPLLKDTQKLRISHCTGFHKAILSVSDKKYLLRNVWKSGTSKSSYYKISNNKTGCTNRSVNRSFTFIMLDTVGQKVLKPRGGIHCEA